MPSGRNSKRSYRPRTELVVPELLIVDVLGLVVSCFVSAVNVADAKAAPAVLVPALENNSRLEKNLADQSYRRAIALLLQMAYECTLELTEKLGQGFVVEP